jgi:hypothetical protein
LILLGFSPPSGDFHRSIQPNVKAFALSQARGTWRRRKRAAGKSGAGFFRIML